MTRAAFLTGATGFIGGEILRRLLADEPERRIYALVRAGTDAEAVHRGRATLSRLLRDDAARAEDASTRVRWCRGDLARPSLELEPALLEEVEAECDEIFHAAASTRFDLPLEEAAAHNLGGTRAVGELAIRAARGGRLRRLVHVSTAYVAGRRIGTVSPEELPGPEAPFNNTYEETKALAERWLRERMGDAPITVVRPSIVVPDGETTRAPSVLALPLALLFRGRLSRVPGRRRTTLDIVAVDYVCDATLALARDPRTLGRTLHITAGEDAIPLGRFGDRVLGIFNRERALRGEPPVARPRVVPPPIWRLARRREPRRPTLGREKPSGARGRAALDLYLPYLASEMRFEASATRRALEGRLSPRPIEAIVDRLAELVAAHEGGA